VWIPAGRFQMGSPESEDRREAIEGPVHTVNIDYALAVGKYPITRGEWQQSLAQSGSKYGSNCWGWYAVRTAMPAAVSGTTNRLHLRAVLLPTRGTCMTWLVTSTPGHLIAGTTAIMARPQTAAPGKRAIV
jgi:formylglycine-generating enzyme required for sulfatase activity